MQHFQTKAAGVDEDVLMNFTREDLKDLFGGLENFCLRMNIYGDSLKNRYLIT